MTCAFIDDGYTETQIIREEPGLHPAVRLQFRPLTPSEVAQWSQECEHKRGVALKEATAKWMNGHIVEWDLPKPPETANLLKLRPSLFDRIFNMLWGYAAGDEVETDSKNSQAG